VKTESTASSQETRPPVGRARGLARALWGTRRRAAASALAVLLLLAAAGAGGRRLWLDHLYRAAEAAHERRDFDTALDCLTRYLEADPSSGRAHFLAARAARRAARWDEAEAHLAACQRLDVPKDALALERVLMNVQRGDPSGEPYLRERIDQDHPDTPLILEVLIDEYVRTYRLWDALDALNDFLKRRPDDVKALLGRAYVWERMFYFADAEIDYRRALEVAPDDDEARLRFAVLLLDRRGSPAQAAEQFERLLGRRPDDPRVRLGLARGRRQQGRLDDARRLLDAVLAADPHYPGALTEMGRLAAEEEARTDEAVGWLRKAVADDPHDRQAYTVLLGCLRRAGRDEEARAVQQTLNGLDADLKRLDELTRAALQRPRDPDLRCDLGVVFLRVGQEQEGLRWLGLALEQDPAHKGAHGALADYFERKGQPDRAAPHRRFAPKE
jgi:tetratricopeptide (TPR) repeat protein